MNQIVSAPVNSMPVVTKTRQFGSARINSIEDLQSCGYAFESRSSNTEIEAQIEESASTTVTADAVIFTSDPQDPVYNRCLSLIKASGLTAKVFICTQQIIQHIKASQDHSKRRQQVSEIYSEDLSEAETMFSSMVLDAIKNGASDIKIFIRAEMRSTVLFKIKGTYTLIKEYSRLDREQYLQMMRNTINYLLHKNNGDSRVDFNEDIPTDLQIPIEVKGYGLVKLRLGIMPGEHGSLGVAFRIPQLDVDGKIKSLSELGFEDEHVALITDAMKAPYGLVIFSGPTGSGKTTAIASAMQLLPDNSPAITLDDPVEITLHSKTSILQCPIHENDPDRDWLAMLRQALRQDPDVIGIGEIRDEKVAQVLSRAAGTGHLCLSTLHVNGAIDIPSQLGFYKLPLHKIAESSFLRLLVATRLVKGVCQSCSTRLSEQSDEDRNIRRLKEYFRKHLDAVRITNPDGCKHCDYTGVSGRHLIAEVIEPDGKGRKLILSEQYDEWREYLLAQGWRDMKMHAEMKIKKGLICPIEAEGHVISPFGVDSGSSKVVDYNKYREKLNVSVGNS